MIYLTQKQIPMRSILALLLLTQMPTTQAHTIPWKFLLCASPFIHSLYTYYDALPHTNPDRYSKDRLMKKWHELKKAYASGNKYAIKCSVSDVVIELKYYYQDWLVGHPSAVHGPERNDQTGHIEMIAIPARGVYGEIGSFCDPLVKGAGLALFVKYAVQTRGETIFKLIEEFAGAAPEKPAC